MEKEFKIMILGEEKERVEKATMYYVDDNGIAR